MEKAYIMYRANDLLDQDVPVIAKALEEVGYEVKIKRFEKGTEEKLIREWANDEYDKLRHREPGDEPSELEYLVKSRVVLTDRTVGDCVDLINPDDIGSLDKTINEALFKEILGKDEYNMSMEETKQAYLSILSKIQLPKKVYVSSVRLADHAPFKKDNDNYAEACENAAQTFASWFKEAGVPEVVKECVSVEEDKNYKNQGNWVIVDRHALTSQTGYSPRSGYVHIRAPFGNFWQDINGHKLLQTEEQRQNEDYSEKLTEYIKQRFGRE